MKKCLIFLLIFLLLLASCEKAQPGETKDGRSIAVYYAALEPAEDGSAIAAENHTISDTDEPVEELMTLLLGGPASPKLTSPVPAGITLSEWSLEDGVLHLELSEGYGGLSGIDLTIADYCIALTLCQLSEVRSVIISVDGDLLPSRYNQALRSSDVLLSALEDDPVYFAADLYFPSADGRNLVVEQRDVLTGEGTKRSAAVVNALIKGPETENLQSLMPEGVVLRSTEVENGVCYVNFSAAFGESPFAYRKEGTLLLYSVVNTLCSLSGVDEVQLLIEGEAPASFGGIPTLKPLEPDYSLVTK